MHSDKEHNGWYSLVPLPWFTLRWPYYHYFLHHQYTCQQSENGKLCLSIIRKSLTFPIPWKIHKSYFENCHETTSKWVYIYIVLLTPYDSDLKLLNIEKGYKKHTIPFKLHMLRVRTL